MTPDTKTLVLEAAIVLASEDGWSALTRDAVASRAGVSTGMVNQLWMTMDTLRDAVLAAAVQRQILPLIAHGLVARHPAALAAPPLLKKAALDSLLGA
jgi:AcrR family transcriptional regulator